jgi:hypothetical protein
VPGIGQFDRQKSTDSACGHGCNPHDSRSYVLPVIRVRVTDYTPIEKADTGPYVTLDSNHGFLTFGPPFATVPEI